MNDAAGIATVHVAAWRETYRGMVADEVLSRLSVQRRTEQWLNSLSDEKHAYHRAFVAEINNQVIGFTSYGEPQIKDSVNVWAESISMRNRSGSARIP